jgi:hypothetical protein
MNTVSPPPVSATDRPLPRRCPPLGELTPEEQARYDADLAYARALRRRLPAA